MSTMTNNAVAISQKRIATFLRIFKPKMLVVGSNNGLIWLTDIGGGSDHNTMCIGSCTEDHMVKFTVQDFGKWVRSAGVKSDVTFSFHDEGFQAHCDKLGQRTFTSSSHDKKSGPDGLDNLGDFEATIPAEVVATLNDIVACCDTESSRYALGGVCVEHNVAVATDGRRLAKIDFDSIGAPEWKTEPVVNANGKPMTDGLPWQSLIPAGLIRYAAAFGEPIDIFGRGLVAGDVRCNKIEGRFPNWRNAIPDDCDTAAVYDGVALLEMCDRQIARNKASDENNNSMTIERTDADGNQFSILMDPVFVKDAVKGLDAVRMRWNASKIREPNAKRKIGRYLYSPILCDSDDRPGWNYVIMPMREG